MSENAKLAVGDRLWLVERTWNGFPRQYEVVVSKVGRVWAHISDVDRADRSHGRIDLETLAVDGGQYISPGRCFRSQAEYEERLRLAEAWDDFRKQVSQQHRRPDHLTIADIEAASAALCLSGPSA